MFKTQKKVQSGKSENTILVLGILRPQPLTNGYASQLSNGNILA